MDIVRVLRVIEYVGSRTAVERTVAKSVQGTKVCGLVTIKAATIGSYPEILESKQSAQLRLNERPTL